MVGGGIGLASGVLGAYFVASRRPVENYYRRLASVPIMASGVCVCVMLLNFGVQASRALDFRRPGVWGVWGRDVKR